jgi:GNAT superfamily N-acetyltransferase
MPALASGEPQDLRRALRSTNLKATRVVAGFLACHAVRVSSVALSQHRAVAERASVRPALVSDIPVLTTVLARAFDADPFFNWFVLPDSRRAERFRSAFDLVLRRMSKNLSETVTTTSLEGCAVWKRPGEHALGFLQEISLMPAFARVMGWRMLPRFSSLLARAQGLHDRLAPLPHYYLFVLGVDPVEQHRGVGGQLLQPVLGRCDAEQKLAYLETARAENLPFYARHGFCVVHVLDEVGFPKLWLMLREPAAPSSLPDARDA